MSRNIAGDLLLKDKRTPTSTEAPLSEEPRKAELRVLQFRGGEGQRPGGERPVEKEKVVPALSLEGKS